jgi:hypothetical protein
MRLSAVIAASALLLGLSSPARAEEPQSQDEKEKVVSGAAPKESTPAPPAYPPPSARWGVIGAGIATSAIFYGAAAGMSYAFPDAPGAQDLRTPIIGPWKAIANNGCAADEPDCSNVWLVMRSVATAIGGIAQAGGILVALEGVFMPTQYAPDSAAPTGAPKKKSNDPVPEGEPPPPKPEDGPKPGDKNLFWMPTPMALGERGVGLGVLGRF